MRSNRAPQSAHACRSTMYRYSFDIEPDGEERHRQRIETPEMESYSSMIPWDLPQRGALPPLRMYWYDGGMQPHRPVELDSHVHLPKSGLLFVGDHGKLFAGYSGGNERPLPEKESRDFKAPPKTLARTTGHYQEWIDACKTAKPTTCDFEFGSRMAKIAQLGAMAVGAARPLEWDATAERVTNDAEANSWVNPPYRKDRSR